MSRALLRVACAACATVASASASCDTMNGTYTNEKGTFSMSWCFPTSMSIEVTMSAAGSAYVGVGFGGSMYQADIVAGWIDANGNAVCMNRAATGLREQP